MKVVAAVLTSLHLVARFATAHPFYIVDARITPAAVLPPVPTHHLVARQNLLDDLQNAANSLLGISTTSSTSSSKKNKATTTSSISVKTLGPPATASAVSPPTPTDDQTSTSTDDSSSTSTSSVSSTGSISPTSTSSASIAPATSAASSAKATASSSSDNGGVPPGGVALAVIFSLIAVAVTAWLIFRYHPKSRAWWSAREAKKFQERSYRDAIDGPGSLRSEAMGGGVSRRQTILKSFFAPATVKLGGGQEIRRKPVNWGAGSTHTPSIRSETPPLPSIPIDMEKIPVDSEKIPMTAAAAPMGQIERYSYLPQTRPQDLAPPPLPEKAPELPPKALTSVVSPMSMRADEDVDRLPPISPLSTRAHTERTLPSLPPVPALPGLSVAKRGSDGIFRIG